MKRRLALPLTLAFAAPLALACGPAPEPTEGVGDALYVHDQTLWPAGHIPVCFETPGYADEKSWVRSAVEGSWARVANVSFSGFGACAADAVGVRIALGDQMVVFGGLGRRADGTSRMELDVRDEMPDRWSQCTENDLGRSACLKAVAIHEFGHALGFAHEQNRPDTPDDCDRAPQGADGNRTIGPWDPDSIMNYCADADRLSAGDVAGAQAVYGKPVLYDVVLRPSDEPELAYYGQSYDAHRGTYSVLYALGWRIHQLTTYRKGDTTARDTILRRTSEPEYRLYGWTTDALRARYSEIWPDGWRLYLLNTVVVDGVRRHDAVFHQTGGGELYVFGASRETFLARNEEYNRSRGMRLQLVNTYFLAGEKRYDAVWKPSGAGEAYAFDVSPETYRREYDRLWAEGFRLHVVSSYVEAGQVRMHATWRRAGGGELQGHRWRVGSVKELVERRAAEGWRVHRLGAYPAE